MSNGVSAVSTQSAAEPTPGSGVHVYTGEAKDKPAEKAAQSAIRKLENDSITEDDGTGEAVLVDDAGLDRVRYNGNPSPRNLLALVRLPQNISVPKYKHYFYFHAESKHPLHIGTEWCRVAPYR